MIAHYHVVLKPDLGVEGRCYLLFTFVALAAVGRINDDPFPPPPPPLFRVVELARAEGVTEDRLAVPKVEICRVGVDFSDLEADKAFDDDGLWLFSLKLWVEVMRVSGSLALLRVVFLGPILEPLELLREAGALETNREELPPSPVLFDEASGFLGGDSGCVERNGTFLTVFVDTALLIDDRELRRLALELLRSTSRRVVLTGAESVFLIEVARLLDSVDSFDGAAPRNDRLFSRLC